MFADREDKKHCPVENFRKYISHLNPDNEAFFQAPRINIISEQDIWYQNQPLGVNTLFNMMAKMSEDGKLSKRYTNHCIRKTTASALDQYKFTLREIQSVTGLKCAASLEPYLGGPTHKTKVAMSNALAGYGRKKVCEVPEDSTSLDADASAQTYPTQVRSPPACHPQPSTSRPHETTQAYPTQVRSPLVCQPQPSTSHPQGGSATKNVSYDDNIHTESGFECLRSPETNTSVEQSQMLHGLFAGPANLTNCIFHVNVQVIQK